MNPLRRRPWEGAKGGVFAMAILLLFRSAFTGFDRAAVVAFLLSGALAGLLFGLCIPYTRTRLGSSLVGIVVLAPIFAVQASFERLEWWSYVIAGTCVGALTGYLVRDQVHPELDNLPGPSSLNDRR